MRNIGNKLLAEFISSSDLIKIIYDHVGHFVEGGSEHTQVAFGIPFNSCSIIASFKPAYYRCNLADAVCYQEESNHTDNEGHQQCTEENIQSEAVIQVIVECIEYLSLFLTGQYCVYISGELPMFIYRCCRKNARLVGLLGIVAERPFAFFYSKPLFYFGNIHVMIAYRFIRHHIIGNFAGGVQQVNFYAGISHHNRVDDVVRNSGIRFAIFQWMGKTGQVSGYITIQFLVGHCVIGSG